MAPYTKPETVLRRSEELLSVNQPMSALASISEIFSSKRFRQTPLASLEPIMLRFIDLCVQLRKTRNVKEGLHMYKNVAQNTSVSSVELVIQHFITKSKERLTEALAKVDEIEGPAVLADADKPAADVDDLEATETPESLLLSTVSEEKSRDRTYRELVTPWLRSLWEAYRTALDILRNNARLENVYQQVATEAFEFCLTHDRKTEFRRLAETLRSNLSSSQKYTNQAHSINLSDPEVLQRHLETRFQQLNTSVKLELWQESFRTAEDINGLIGLSKKVPKSHVMSAFYEKMIKVFGVGENHLFHAAAYNKFYAIQAHALADQPEKLERLSGLVLLAALAVPIASVNAPSEAGKKPREGEEEGASVAKTKLGRLASLLGLSTLPTRASLLRDALLRGALKKAPADLRALYEILEQDFHPLSITAKMQPLLERLQADPETARYVEPLKEVVLTRLFQQLAQVYDSLKLARIVKLAAFGDGAAESLAATRVRVEKFLMEACKRGELEVQLDHSSQLIKFGDRMFESGMHQPGGAVGVQPGGGVPLGLAAASGLVPAQTGATNSVLQPSSSTLLRTHLTRLASALTLTLQHIAPSLAEDSTSSLQMTKAAAIQLLNTAGPKLRKDLLKRKQTIEDRRRKASELKLKVEQQEAKAKQLRMIQIQEEQEQRLRKQNKERESRKLMEEAEKIRKVEAEKVAVALAAQAGLNVDIKNLKGVDTNMIIQMGVSQLEKEKKELAIKLKTVNKRLDHTERALRLEEQPLLVDDYKMQQERDVLNFETLQKEVVEGLKARHEKEVEIKHKLEKMMGDFLGFKEEVAKKRGHDYQRAQEEARVRIERAKAERRAELIAARKQERARQAEEERLAKEKEEEERLRREEDERLEEERKVKQAEIEAQEKKFKEAAAEKAKKLREERELERKAALEMATKQAQREAEALARRENKKLTERATPVGSAAPVAAASAGAWRPTRVAGELPPTAAAPVAAAAATPVAATPAAPVEERRPPVILAATGKPGGWRERQAAKEMGGSGGSSPAPASRPGSGVGAGGIGLSRGSSGAGSGRRDQEPQEQQQGAGGLKPSGGSGSYRPPQSRMDSNTSAGGGARSGSGRGSGRW